MVLTSTQSAIIIVTLTLIIIFHERLIEWFDTQGIRTK